MPHIGESHVPQIKNSIKVNRWRHAWQPQVCRMYLQQMAAVAVTPSPLTIVAPMSAVGDIRGSQSAIAHMGVRQ